ncbi:MAG: hypothetical protein HY675_03315 [Chloroflexi bacterium]|nr:hypothetical protein [Chloroflexota bacterium]
MDDSRKVVAAITGIVLVFALISLLSSVGAMAWRVGGPGWGMGPGMMGRMPGPGAFSQPVAPTPTPTDIDSGWPFAPWVLVLVVIAAVVLLAWLIATRNHRAAKPVGKHETPLEIAKRRYVTGEIRLPEYEEILHVLTRNGEIPEARGESKGAGGKGQGARS